MEKSTQDIYKKAVKLDPEEKLASSKFIGIISTRNANPDLSGKPIPDYVFGMEENPETKDVDELMEILNRIVMINPIFREVISDTKRFHDDLHSAARPTDIDINNYSVFTWGKLMEGR